MIELEVLTTSLGCAKCEHALEIIKRVTSRYKGKIRVIETDVIKKPDKLFVFSVMTTPAIIIDGKLAFEGALNEAKLDKKIQEALISSS